MRALAPFFALTALTLTSVAVAETAASPADVAAAERAFAAKAKADGMTLAFQSFVADEAVALHATATSAKAEWGARKNRVGPPFLEWYPAYTGVARSGDLGFSTGPYLFDGGKAYGYYFSIWKKQPDGSWKWVLDHGAPLAEKPVFEPGTATEYAPVAKVGSLNQATAFAEVAEAENTLAAALATRGGKAYAPYIADDTRIMGLEPGPTIGRAEVTKALARRPASLVVKAWGGEASKAGDLAYTYGEAHWSVDGKALNGHYVRIWQKRGNRWILLFDEVVDGRENG